MLNEYEQNPASRVFHLDHECYVVYVGSHWDDYKPFVRVGTSTDLPDALKPIVSTIVVPDALTGNPLDEPSSLNGRTTKDTRYLGDAATVERLKAFLNAEDVPSESFQAADHEEEDSRHVFVYFYSDGNIKVKFKKHDVFDLKRREQLDHHFSAHAQEVKNRFARHPFRLPGDVYQTPAFMTVSGRPYLIARGEIAALDLSDSYFFDLAGVGVDPDRIASVRASSADSALIRLFKRSRSRSRQLHVATADAERVNNAIALFGASSLPELKATVLDSGADHYEFHRFAVEHRSSGAVVSLQDLPGPIVFETAGGKRSGKSRADESVLADLAAGTLTLRASGGSQTLKLMEGVPYVISSTPLTRSGLAAAYLPEKSIPYRDLLSQTDNSAIAQLVYFFTELWAGRDTAKVVKSLRSLLRNDSEEPHPLMRLVRHNVRETLRFLVSNEPELAKKADALAAVLGREAEDLGDIPVYLPIVADLHITADDAYCFFRHATRITSDRVAHAEQVYATTINQPVGTDFVAERGRLEDLISALANPEEMEAARERRRAERDARAAEAAAGAAKDVAKKPVSDDRTSDARADARATREATADKGRTKAGPGAATTSRGRARDPGSDRGSALRWILPAAIVLIVLGALGALFATSVIPSPFGRQDTDSVAGNGRIPGNGGDQPGATPGAESPGATPGGSNGEPGGSGQPGGEGPGPVDTGGTSPGTDGRGQTGQPDGGDGETPVVPDNWPEEALPALEVLRQTPGITITAERVVGPGGIEITVRDIITLVNRIATDNGYARMHADVPRSEDPDWIYPGNIFVLPDETRYTVVRGDTLWDLTIRYMVARLQEDYTQYTTLVREYESADTSSQRKQEIIQSLNQRADESHTENYVQLVNDKIAEWERQTN